MAFSMVWHVTAKTTKKTTVWRKTRTANLYEHLQSGRYYAVAWVNGKQVFKSLKTDSAEHAKIKLPTVLKEFGKMGRRKENVHPPETSIGRLSERYLESVRTSVKNKASTAHYREQTVKALFRSWPELKAAKPKDITEGNCLEWAKRFSTMETVRGHNQKTDRETTTSPTDTTTRSTHCGTSSSWQSMADSYSQSRPQKRVKKTRDVAEELST